jgi:hypothetical protein
MNTTATSNGQAIATEILRQLGGNKFLVMTGSKNLLFADITDTNKNVWLRMDLTRNKAGVNRLKITLNGDDTYTMHFYKQVIKNYVDVVISKEQKFEGIYCDQLQEIFTQVTGLYTHL